MVNYEKEKRAYVVRYSYYSDVINNFTSDHICIECYPSELKERLQKVYELLSGYQSLDVFSIFTQERGMWIS